MDSIIIPTIQAIIVIVTLIAVGLVLKKRGIIADQHRPLFGRLVTDFALPALIFSGLVTREPRFEILLGVLVMVLAVCIHIILSWIIGKILHLNQPQLGSFMLVAAFGSSATLGYALITQIFPHNKTAITDAVMISELGIGVPLFIIGVIIAMHYGQKGEGSFFLNIKSYLLSPIFISLIAGVLASFLLAGMKNPVWEIVLSTTRLIAASLIIFVALSVALMLKRVEFKSFGILAIVTVFLSLILQPLIAYYLSDLVHISRIETDVLVLETAMPSGMIAAVLSDRYGCDGQLASILVLITYIFSLVTLPLVMMFAS